MLTAFTEYWWLSPALAGALLALIGGPLGSFIIWQRMAYMGESIAHSALLGVALSVWLNVSSVLMIAIVCVSISLILFKVQNYLTLSLNTLLAIIAHTALASGLVLISLLPEFRIDIHSLLFGDLLTIDNQYLLILFFCITIISIFLTLNWHNLISMSANAELAFVEGIQVKFLQLMLNTIIALLIAVSIKAVGVLLIISLLIIPAATSRSWTQSPETMAFLASTLGFIYVIAGMLISYLANVPTGPAIVALAGLGYFLGQFLFLTLNRKI